MRNHYVIKETEGFQSYNQFWVRVFTVAGDKAERQTPNVWVSVDDSPRCTSCNTPLRGMSSSCAHAKAIRRYLRKEDKR